ncbi:hypothetical protein QBC43DRAFT_139948 [Cladorrhinum sp. PSN259]|nr:hypothetical protein QBC43DRAFT_139948 [Cladorrhinum sp. PSN259]
MEMEYSHHGIPMNNELAFDEDDVLFSHGSMPGPGIQSNGSMSSGCSSYASSFGPHTPLSGTSTPSRNNSFDFNTSRNGSLDSTSSFATSIDSNSFDLSPPASTTSSYFPVNYKTDDGSEMYQSAFPLTPSRNQPHSINLWESQMSPNSMAYYYHDGVGQHTLISTPPGPVPSSQQWDCEWGPKWLQGDSPISFEGHTPTRLAHSIHGLKIEEPEQHDEFKRRDEFKKKVSMELVMAQAKLLHQVQQQDDYHRTASIQSVRAKAMRQPRARRPPQESDIGIIPQSAHHCDFPGCTAAPYRRNEHLKRHQKSKHEGDRYACPFCDKVVNRKDNWISHVGLHTQQRGKNGRVKFHPEAIKLYEEERAKITRKAVADAVKTKKRTSVAS